MDYAKLLHQLVEHACIDGDVLEGKVHILDMSDEYPSYEGETKYRIYHKDGYCVDISKEPDKVNDLTDQVKTWEYHYTQEWPGFDTIDPSFFYKLVKQELSRK